MRPDCAVESGLGATAARVITGSEPSFTLHPSPFIFHPSSALFRPSRVDRCMATASRPCRSHLMTTSMPSPSVRLGNRACPGQANECYDTICFFHKQSLLLVLGSGLGSWQGSGLLFPLHLLESLIPRAFSRTAPYHPPLLSE